jgi:protein gp37
MQKSSIEWTHHTFNPWRGCAKVSPGCAHCYAETMSKRNPAVLGEWGLHANRIIAVESAWRYPLKWDREAARGDPDEWPEEFRIREFPAAKPLGEFIEPHPSPEHPASIQEEREAQL